MEKKILYQLLTPKEAAEQGGLIYVAAGCINITEDAAELTPVMKEAKHFKEETVIVINDAEIALLDQAIGVLPLYKQLTEVQREQIEDLKEHIKIQNYKESEYVRMLKEANERLDSLRKIPTLSS